MSDIRQPVAVTGMGWELPGLTIESLLQAEPAGLDGSQFDPAAKLGRKGLRYKDHATLLALAAGRDALLNARLPATAAEQHDKPAFGAVVSCSLGNLDTVAKVLQVIRSEHVDATSAMDLPNASSNVVASSLAIRFGLQGINLMLCNGTRSGLDALHLAANCIRAGRASRMLVVGVEVDTPVARDLLGPVDRRLFNGAVAVVLESLESADARGAAVAGLVGGYDVVEQVSPDDLAGAACLVSSGALLPESVPADSIDVASLVGESYSAEGVVQLVAALERLALRGQRQGILLGGGRFGDSLIGRLEVEGPS